MGAFRVVFYKHCTGGLILLRIRRTAGDLQHRFSVAPAFLGLLFWFFLSKGWQGQTSLRAQFIPHSALLRFCQTKPNIYCIYFPDKYLIISINYFPYTFSFLFLTLQKILQFLLVQYSSEQAVKQRSVNPESSSFYNNCHFTLCDVARADTSLLGAARGNFWWTSEWKCSSSSAGVMKRWAQGSGVLALFTHCWYTKPLTR